MDLDLAEDERIRWCGTISWRAAMLNWWSVLTLGLFAALKRRQHEYVITTHRIHRVEGLLGTTSTTVRIPDVREVDVSWSILGRLLDVGTIGFSSAGAEGAQIVFEGVDDPQRIQDIYSDANSRIRTRS